MRFGALWHVNWLLATLRSGRHGLDCSRQLEALIHLTLLFINIKWICYFLAVACIQKKVCWCIKQTRSECFCAFEAEPSVVVNPIVDFNRVSFRNFYFWFLPAINGWGTGVRTHQKTIFCAELTMLIPALGQMNSPSNYIIFFAASSREIN